MTFSVCFISPGLDFDALTPFERPLGGSESAAVYLAAELARRGHRVTILTKTMSPRSANGIECLNLTELQRGFLAARGFDAVIVLNGPAAIAGWLQPVTPAVTARILWTQHAVDQPSMKELGVPEKQRHWDEIICISDWHRRSMIDTFKLDPGRTAAIWNAIGTSFENLFADPNALMAAKSTEPLCAYTSTPFRGLDVLLEIFPGLHAKWRDLRLDIYSSMQVYQMPDDAFAQLYAKAQSMPGVRYLGSVAQPKLAGALRGVSLLTYPNTFPETFCISALEALAAGAHIVTSDLGALPETTLGFADIVSGTQDTPRFSAAFADQVDSALSRRANEPAAFAERCFEQVRAVNRSHTWKVRADEWETAIARWVRRRQGNLQ